jgi:hypothetical protein
MKKTWKTPIKNPLKANNVDKALSPYPNESFINIAYIVSVPNAYIIKNPLRTNNITELSTGKLFSSLFKFIFLELFEFEGTFFCCSRTFFFVSLKNKKAIRNPDKGNNPLILIFSRVENPGINALRAGPGSLFNNAFPVIIFNLL